MSAYYIVYFLLISSIFVEHIRGVELKAKKRVLLSLVALLTLFRGLRWETGTDWRQFEDVFNTISVDNVFSMGRYLGVSLEPGFALLNLIWSYSTGSYTLFLLFFNAIILLIYYSCSVRYVPDKPIYAFSLIILFTAIFPLRQGLACAMILYAFRYVLARDLVRYTIVILLATSMHNSAILIFPFYYILPRNIPLIALVAGYLVSLVLSYTPLLGMLIEQAVSLAAMIMGVESSLLGKIINYALVHEKDTDRGIGVALFSIARSSFFIAVFSYYRAWFLHDKSYTLYFNSFFISLYIGTLFKFQMQEIIRMQDYFIFGFCFVSAKILGELPNNKRKVLFAIMILYSMYTAKKFFDLFPLEMIPYKTISG